LARIAKKIVKKIPATIILIQIGKFVRDKLELFGKICCFGNNGVVH
jgi:hypothetical protein